MTRCLRLSSCWVYLLLAGCFPYAENFRPAKENAGSAIRYKPEFNKRLYRCIVDGQFFFKKFHLSGILLFKTLPDSSTRVLFQNEMGYSFFDFGWDENEHFSIYAITPQMNKGAVIKTLRKDLEVLLMMGLDTNEERVFISPKKMFNYRFPLSKGYVYYVADQKSLSEKAIVIAKRKKAVEFHFNAHKNNTLPQNFEVVHLKANFKIIATELDTANVE